MTIQSNTSQSSNFEKQKPDSRFKSFRYTLYFVTFKSSHCELVAFKNVEQRNYYISIHQCDIATIKEFNKITVLI